MKTPAARTEARVWAPCVLLTVWLLTACPCAHALDAALDVDQYAHTAWRIREGFAKGTISSIAQTPDGYLWLGTDLGLFRFDGVRNIPWQPPRGQSLPKGLVFSLLAAGDGKLWIGTASGLASWQDGILTTHARLAGWRIVGLREDRDGTIWITARVSVTRSAICSIRQDDLQCEGEDGRLGQYLSALYVDSGGRLWVAASDGVWRWRPGAPQFFPIADLLEGAQVLCEDDAGALLIATRRGVMRLENGSVAAFAPTANLPPTASMRLLRDRDGALWAGTAEHGIAHIHRGRVDTYAGPDGLSGERINRLFEDREGNIWAATRAGLDRFRALAIPTLAKNQGLPDTTVGAVLAARDGSVWISTLLGLSRWRSGELTRYRGQDLPTVTAASGSVRQAREVRVAGLTARLASLFEDHRGRLWVGAEERLGYLEKERWVPLEGVPSGYVDAITGDSQKNVWIAHRSFGLLRIADDGRLSRLEWTQLGRNGYASRLAVDSKHGGIWVGFFSGGVTHVVDGRVITTHGAADGLTAGRVNHLHVDADGTLWIGSDGGLSRIRDDRIVKLDGSAGLPCDHVDWMSEDVSGAVWIRTSCGIVRVARQALERWMAAPMRKPDLKIFTDSDGARSSLTISTLGPHVSRSPDGKLWFGTPDGVGVIDPRNLARNVLPPPVHIERVLANRTSYEATSALAPLALPPLIRDLQINYTALSLAAPERMQFRYRLIGRDAAWQNAATRREAFYTDLAPGKYRFEVTAANNDGVWNEPGAALDFSIAATFYQTTWFRVLCAALVIAALSTLYALRVRQIEMRAQMRLAERMAERERIARDLHDTILQSVQGLILKFHAVMLRMPEGAPPRDMMEQALERADEVVAQGRDQVYGLRDPLQARDLAQALADVAGEFAHLAKSEFRITAEGTPRALHPMVREEAFRIGAEALINSLRHAKARHIDIEIEYSRRALCLRVIDDGCGFDVNALQRSTRHGHFGLTGVYERARRISAQLEISSGAGSGSAVELRVPAAIAYAPGRS